MGTGMLLSAYVDSVIQLTVLRFFTGVGIGAIVPIVTPMAAEYSNTRWRAMAIAVMALGFPLGGMLGGFIAAPLLHWFSWHAVFLFGAGLALIMWPVVLIGLHEPLAILLESREAGALVRVNKLLRLYGLTPVGCIPPGRAAEPTAPYRAIFRRDQIRATMRATLVNALFVMCVYFVLSWMPQLITDQGYAASTASWAPPSTR